MQEIQEIILCYLENIESDELDFHNLISNLKDLKIHKSKRILKETLYLISKISENHHRELGFINKIERILKTFEKEIKKFFTNSDIFNIFIKNKRILLFLFEQKIIIPNKLIFQIITSKKYKEIFYPEYFFTEFENFYDENYIRKSISYIPENKALFEENRKFGENETRICKMVQNDLIDDFITLVNQSNIKLNSTIQPSIFETNSFLLKKEASLIEYASFYGSIQIFQYLKLNGIDLNPSLWSYAIHSNNAEMIHILEDCQDELNIYSFKKYYKESIKCHHINIMEYIKNSLYRNEREKDVDLFIKSLNFHNYIYMSDIVINEIATSNKFYNSDLEMSVKEEFDIFYGLCKNDYLYLAEIFLKIRKINVNMVRI